VWPGAWPLLVQAGLAKIEDGRLKLTVKGRTALRKPAAEVIRQLWQRWLTHALIDEFSRIEEIKGQRARNVLTSAKTRRQIVAAALASCPADEWISVAALFTTMRRGNMSPTIARNEMALWKLYLVDAHYGSPGLRRLSPVGDPRKPLHAGGAVRIRRRAGTARPRLRPPTGARDDFQDNWGEEDLDALSRYDGLRAIRLTALGRYALGLTDTYQRPSGDNDTQGLKVLPLSTSSPPVSSPQVISLCCPATPNTPRTGSGPSPRRAC
jgi:hypothetical protein